MLCFELDFWDYVTSATLALGGAGFVVTLLWFAGLPGGIALASKHPEAEAVNLMGWAGIFPTVYPWVQAFIWAVKPTDIIDIRRWPREEARAVDAEIARLRGEPAQARSNGPAVWRWVVTPARHRPSSQKRLPRRGCDDHRRALEVSRPAPIL